VTANFSKAPTLVTTPVYKNFGTVRTGRTTTATFTVKNASTQGIADLTMGPASITGTGFALVPGKDNCSGQTLAPGKTCTFKVSFTPAGTGSASAVVSIPSNDPNSPSNTQVWGVAR
jgi:hypothetical protein